MRIAILFAAVAAAGIAACLGVLALLRDGGGADPLLTLALACGALLGVAVLILWGVVDRLVLRDVAALAGETRALSYGTSAARLSTERHAALAPLAQAINEMSEKLTLARNAVDLAVATSTARVEEQKGRLAAVLRDLDDGVLVCNRHHQVLLYNRTALRLLHLTGDIGIGRDLLQIVTKAPVLHTLERLTRRVMDERHHGHPAGASAEFVAATTDGRFLLQGTMSLLLQDDGITGYVVTFSDETSTLVTLGERDALLRSATEGLHGIVANLRAAAETLHDHPDLPDEARRLLGDVLNAESRALSDRLKTLTGQYRALITGAWPMSDVHSGTLIDLVIARTRGSGGPAVTPTGLPQWIYGDSFSLVVLLDHLLKRLAAATGADAFDLSAETTASWVLVDAMWRGAPVPASVIEGWTAETLPDAPGGLRVGDVLEHHRSDLWSEAAGPGMARLRLPLPLPRETHGPVGYVPPAPRPEFFDFDLLHQPVATSELGRTPLRELTYIVFDTETTGLQPSTGDEIISIAGVRIVNGRILTGETFCRFVDPGRPIPRESIRFHGITDESVRDCPPITDVLPQFRAFVSGAVLVAHNAAFDLKFLKLKERAAGVAFDNPVLDTMLLSRHLFGDEADHSLDGIAQRLGIRVVDRHTALGDALLTAAVFLRFVDMLSERGAHTLDDAIRSANIQVELRARERAF